MEEKKNTGLIIALIVFIILTVSLCGFIVYDKVLKPKEDNPITETNTEEKQENTFEETDFIRNTKLVLVDEPACTGAATPLEAEINENKNIAISQNLGAEEIIVGNAKYLYKIGLFVCDSVTLYYITEDNQLFKIASPSAGTPNQKGTKVSSSQIIEFLGEDHREDGSYLKVLTKDNVVEYIKYFTSPDYYSE